MIPAEPHWASRHAAELRLMVRVTVAAVFTYGLAASLGLAQGSWAVLTAIIVMQASLGASIQAAADRFLGTIGGAAWGAAIAAVVPHASPAALGLALTCAVAPLSLLSALKPSFRVAPITALIVLMPSAGQAGGPVDAAFARVLEILLGNGVGLAVALFVLPARARTLLAETAAQILELQARLVPAILANLDPSREALAIEPLHGRMRAAMKELDAVAGEANREFRSHLSDDVDAEPLIRVLHRLRHDLVTLERACSRPMPTMLHDRLAPSLTDVAGAARVVLDSLAAALRARSPIADMRPLDEALQSVRSAINAIRRDHVTHDLPSDDVENFFALGFALDELRRDVHEAAGRVGERSGPTAKGWNPLRS
ncbi:MAG: FUSC family protein [Microvirga sp.]